MYLQDDEDYIEPSTSSVATPVQPLEAEPDIVESRDEEEEHSGRKDGDPVNKEEGDSEQVNKESPKRGSSVRSRKKTKKSKEKHKKGLHCY